MMNFEKNSPAWRVVVIILTLWGIAFTLACRLLNMPENRGAGRAGVAAKMFGIMRGEIGGQFYEQADLVFHKGVGHSHPAASRDPFARLRREVAPSGHAHLHAEGTLEIMPWLYFATRADPGNVTAYAVAAYWLADENGRPDLAERVLNEALSNNPSDHRVHMEMGRLSMKTGKYKKAARQFDAALHFLPPATEPDNEGRRNDRAEILTYRGLLYEMDGCPEKAARCYRETTGMFPGRLQLKERTLELEKNGKAAEAPEELAKALLFQRRYVCAEGEDE